MVERPFFLDFNSTHSTLSINFVVIVIKYQIFEQIRIIFMILIIKNLDFFSVTIYLEAGVSIKVKIYLNKNNLTIIQYFNMIH